MGGKLKNAARLAVQEEKENNTNNNHSSDKGSVRVNGTCARRPSLALDQAANSFFPGRAADIPWTEYLGVSEILRSIHGTYAPKMMHLMSSEHGGILLDRVF